MHPGRVPVEAPFHWRERLAQVRDQRRGYVEAVQRTLNWLRSPHTPGNSPAEGEESRVSRFRRLAARLSRAWALCGRTDEVAALGAEARFYEDVRIWMGKLDAEDRQASGEPIPEDVQRLLAELAAQAFSSGDVLDIYAEAGLGRVRIDQIDTGFAERAQASETPHLTIEALRALVASEARAATGGNAVRQAAFSDRLQVIMTRYTNSNLTSAEVIAELVAMAREVAAEKDRGKSFDPPLGTEELALFDAIAANPSALELQGEGTLAQIARELVAVMRRDVKTDWTVRDDVRAKLRSSVKRLLIKYDYPPDKRADAVVLVIEQMEALARRHAA